MNNRFIVFIISFCCSIYNFFQRMKYGLFGNHQLKQKVKDNRKLKNAYKGKRCFIFGNGPSLKNVDFSLFEEEYVFTVNTLYKKEDFLKLKSNFHVWADKVFFNDDVSADTANGINHLLLNYGTQVFFPSYTMDFVKQYDLTDKVSIYNPVCHFNEKYKGKISLDRCVMNYSSVVFQCIQIAVYMGFSEIYLLGCDCTGIQSVISERLEKTNNAYCYTVDETSKKIIDYTMNKRDMQSYFQGWANIFKQYKYINQYAKNHGVKLFNLTNPTILDSIERMNLDDVLKKKD